MNRIATIGIPAAGLLLSVLAAGQTALTGTTTLRASASQSQPASQPTGGKLVFEDKFKDMSNWVSEGPHKVEVKDGRLHVVTDTAGGQIGQYVWCKRELSDDFRVEFDVTPVSASGFFLVFFCVQGVKGEDILGKDLFEDYMPWKSWKEYHDWDKYTSAGNRHTHSSRIRAYHVSYRRNESANCNLRKNPGLVLKKSSAIDALLPKDKTAHVVLTKQGGHITLAVDGKEFMDWTDTETPYKGGKFGFRNVYESDAHYTNVKFFDLSK